VLQIHLPCHADLGVQIDDLEKEWTWSQPFDFIFSRMMTGSFSDNADIVQKAFKYVQTITPEANYM
jgi:hypothetical protein